MVNIKQLFLEKKPKTISQMFSFNNSLEELFRNEELTYFKKVKVAVITSSTLNGLAESLKAESSSFDVLLDCYVSEYNQFAQEILDPTSKLYAFNPELIFLHLDTRTLSGEIYFNPNNPSEDLSDWQIETTKLIERLCKESVKNSKAKVICSNLEVPYISPLGVLESSKDLGLREAVQKINLGLNKKFKKDRFIYIYDYESFSGKLGKQNLFDEKLYYIGDIKIKPNFIPELASELSRYVKASFITPKKCLVLDLDNTLWGGIIGELGIDGIHLGPNPEGRPFMEFQQYILSLYNRGVILAINSKNNYEDALEAIKFHPHMILREANFVAMRINWEDKVKNIKSIAEEINIGTDSMVFLDDDSFNREMVREFLPEVEVVDLPKDFSQYVNTLEGIDSFETLVLTKEDMKKGQMYSQEKERRSLKAEVDDLENYLKMLDMKAFIDIDNPSNIERISQLTNKTNQFNMTTKKYSEQEISLFIKDEKSQVFTLSLSDKFGEYGITGLIILNHDNFCKIDTFLMSCRILGRKAEQALLSYVSQKIIEDGQSEIYASFIKSDKNFVAKDVYKDLGFKPNDDLVYNWCIDLKEEIEFPQCIKLVS